MALDINEYEINGVHVSLKPGDGGACVVSADLGPLAEDDADALIVEMLEANYAFQGAAPENAQSVKAEAKSVVRQLDVLLLGAAKKSVGADTVKNVETVGQSLVRKGVLSETDVTRLKNLAESAAEKLKALDKLRRCQLSRARSRSRNLTAQRLRSGTRSPTSGVIAWSIARRTTSATISTGCSSNVQS